MSYSLHIVRTADWMDAAEFPIVRREVANLVEADPELSWSTTEFMDLRDKNGTIFRLPFIKWQGTSCFLWRLDQILCRNPDDAQTAKMIRIAEALDARVVGDHGERYTLRRTLFGRRKVLATQPEAESMSFQSAS
jgi:hypothetical protein